MNAGIYIYMFACVLNCITHSVKILVTITSCICSIAQPYPVLCNPMDCSMPGFPVLPYLLEFAQTHVHCISDAIQPPHPLSPTVFLPSILPSIRVFSNESALSIRCPKYWSLSFSISPSSENSGLISFRIDWFDLLAIQRICKSLVQHHIRKHQFYRAQPSLWSKSISIHDYWKNHCLTKQMLSAK